MELGTILLILAGVVALIAIFGKGKLADNLRTWITFGLYKAGEATAPTLEAETTAATEKAKNAHRTGRMSLHEVNQKIERHRIDVVAKMEEINRGLFTLKNLANTPDGETAEEKEQREKAFALVVTEINNDKVDYAGLEASLERLEVARDSLGANVDGLAAKSRRMERESRELLVNQAANKVEIMVGESVSGLSSMDGGDSNMEAAREMAKKGEARAAAARIAAEGLTETEKAQRIADSAAAAYETQGVDHLDAAELWEQMTGASEEEAAG